MSSRKIAAKEKLRLILPKVDSIFESEPAVLLIDNEPVMLVGDIHGDLQALEFIIKMREKINCKNILFLGDYVDRGPQGTEVLLSLFSLKIKEPEHVFLLRGNHESVDMNLYYGFFEEIGSDQKFLLRISLTYDKMPIAAVLSGHTFCVHGGINGTESIDTIRKEEPFPYLWNDPSKSPGLTNSRRGSTVKEFGHDIVDGFLKANNLKRIVRGHTALETGYKWWFDGKLLSLFSCPDYAGIGNDAAFSLFENKELEIFVFGNQQK
ncbi:MAG: serine/threonine protein phosphatase [Methanosarcina sp.]|uniref:serine/threonine protein phosphatase n=1 Tax=Methanosarcina sp. TaxID=2213 RepID=UPI003BB710B6